MKKTLTLIILTLAACIGTQAQTTYKVRQNFNLPVNLINLSGKCSLNVICDTVSYLELTNVNGEKPVISKKRVTFDGNAITIEDENHGNVYSLHIDSNTRPFYVCEENANISFTGFPKSTNSKRISTNDPSQNISIESYSIVTHGNGDSAYTTITHTIGDSTYTTDSTYFMTLPSMGLSKEMLEQMADAPFLSPSDKASFDRLREKMEKDTFNSDEVNEWRGLIEQFNNNEWNRFFEQLGNDANPYFSDRPSNTEPHHSSNGLGESFADSFSIILDSINDEFCESKSLHGYDNSDRTDWDFLWGWTNLGHENLLGDPFNMGATTYEPRTTFSSYQVGFNYAVVMTPHWQLKLGFNYESDVYKLNLLNTIPGTTTTTSDPGKLVARYLSVPITIGYRSNDRLGHFRVDIAAVPGYCVGGKAKFGADYDNVNNVANMLNPYKLDVRFDISVSGLKFFVQVPTLPVFKGNNMPKIYPLTFGFMI